MSPWRHASGSARWSSAPAASLTRSSRLNVEALRIAPALVLPPAVEVRARHHVGRDPGVVEVVQRLVVDEDVAPPRARLELLDLVEQRAVGGEERVPCLPVALHERAADEQRARELGVDLPVGDLAAGDDRQAVERRPLDRHDRAALALPVRLVVGALDQVAGERLDPARVDPRRGAAPEPRRLDQLRDHHPARRLARERRPREDREPRAARAAVLPARGVLHAQVREEAGEQRDVDRLRLGRQPVQRDPDALGRLPQLRHEVLPLPDAEVMQELRVAALAELVAGEGELLLAQVPPQVHVREEVRVLVLEARVLLVGLLALVRRPLARVLDRERGRDHDHLLRASQPVGLQHHPPEPGVDRELGEPPSEGRQPLLVVERGQLLQQPDPVADLAPVGRIEEREVRDVAERGRRHLQDHRREVGPEDLGVGERRALLEVLLGVEPHADAVRRAAAAALALVG